LVERLIRNQQVAGSTPAGGSNKTKELQEDIKTAGRYFGASFFRLVIPPGSRARLNQRDREVMGCAPSVAFT
jgi:hypothetical protein